MSSKRKHLGDDGSTGFLGEGRLEKFHPRIEALGALDEASAALGMARALTGRPATANVLSQMQRDLYALMAEIAASSETASRFCSLEQARMDWLESQAHTLEEEVPLPSEFILPGGSLAAAALSLARTIIRRAERRVALLASHREVDNPFILPYLNRLSHVCYLLEIAEGRLGGESLKFAKE